MFLVRKFLLVVIVALFFLYISSVCFTVGLNKGLEQRIDFINQDVSNIYIHEMKSCKQWHGDCKVTTVTLDGSMYYTIVPITRKKGL